MFVLGRNISCDWAISKSKFCEKLEKGLAKNQETINDERQQTEKQPSQDAQKEDDDSSAQKKIAKEKDNLKKQKRKKLYKMRKQKKRARIVIRNLPFQVFVMHYERHFFFNSFSSVLFDNLLQSLYRLRKII